MYIAYFCPCVVCDLHATSYSSLASG